MNDMLVTGMDLKVARIRRQVTASALAVAMGVSPSTLTRIEQRHAIKPDVAEKYNAALATFPAVATAYQGGGAS